jgi:hypothetical protein
MSTQVLRVEGYAKSDLNGIGKECDRADVQHRNIEIDIERTHLNVSFCDAEHGFYHRFHEIKEVLNAEYREKKGSIAFEGIIVTSNLEFFEGLGWKKGEKAPKEVDEFFKKSYDFLIEQIGYNQTDKNIISAKVHYDEKTPHMHIYYVPITDKWQKKVYAKNEFGAVLRSATGSPIQAKDENGKTIFKTIIDKENPKINRTEFWRNRGANSSYRILQDNFYEKIGKNYGLNRGTLGSDRKHYTKYQYQYTQYKENLDKIVAFSDRMNEIVQKGKKILPTTITFKTSDFKPILEHATMYEVEKQQIQNIDIIKKDLNERKCKILKQEVQIERQLLENEQTKKELFDLFDEQKNLNDIHSDLVDKYNDLINSYNKLQNDLSLQKTLYDTLKSETKKFLSWSKTLDINDFEDILYIANAKTFPNHNLGRGYRR